MYDQAQYLIEIVDQELTENSKGNPQLELRFRPVGLYVEERHPDTGERTRCLKEADYATDRTIYLVMTEATMGDPGSPGWVAQTIAWLGLGDAKISQLHKDHPKHVSFIGKRVDAKCEHDTWNGKEREKWNFVRGGSGKTSKSLDKTDLKNLDGRFGKAVASAVESAPEALPDKLPPRGKDKDAPPF